MLPAGRPPGINGRNEIRTKDDVWGGLDDPAERRRRQNRLNQRAWRRRKDKRPASLEGHSHSPNSTFLQSVEPDGQREAEAAAGLPVIAVAGRSPLEKMAWDHVSGRQRIPIDLGLPKNRDDLWDLVETLGEPQGVLAYWGELKAHRKRELVAGLLVQYPSLAGYLSTLEFKTSNVTAATFPLCPDHHLFTLVQYNTLRGTMTNMQIVLQLRGIDVDAWDAMYMDGLPPPPRDSPGCLRPTPLQEAVPHDAWIDVVPCAALRDNIIRAQSTLNIDDLCNDFAGGMHEGPSEVGNRGLVLWGEPWSVGGWEISEGFVRKWWFLFGGCEDMFVATNRWRKVRGEKRMFEEL